MASAWPNIGGALAGTKFRSLVGIVNYGVGACGNQHILHLVENIIAHVHIFPHSIFPRIVYCKKWSKIMIALGVYVGTQAYQEFHGRCLSSDKLRQMRT